MMLQIEYRKGDRLIRRYDGPYVGRKRRRKHCWTGLRLRKKGKL